MASFSRPTIADQIRESWPTEPPWGSLEIGVRGRREVGVGPHRPLEALMILLSVTPALARMLSSRALDQRKREAPAERPGGREDGSFGSVIVIHGVTVSLKVSIFLRALREGRGQGEVTWLAIRVWGALATWRMRPV